MATAFHVHKDTGLIEQEAQIWINESASINSFNKVLPSGPNADLILLTEMQSDAPLCHLNNQANMMEPEAKIWINESIDEVAPTGANSDLILAEMQSQLPCHTNAIDPEARFCINRSTESSDKVVPSGANADLILAEMQSRPTCYSHNRKNTIEPEAKIWTNESATDDANSDQISTAIQSKPSCHRSLPQCENGQLSTPASTCNGCTTKHNSAPELPTVQLKHIPANSLSYRSLRILSMHMNPVKITGNDWKGLADYMRFSYLEIENFALCSDPMLTVMKHWMIKKDSTIGALCEMIGDLEREDLLDALKRSLNIDVKNWMAKSNNSNSAGGAVSGKPVQVPEVSGSNYPNRPTCPEMRGLTINDHPDGPIETFDAYVCHNPDTDYQFVLDMISAMEKPPYNLRFCTDWRDLVPGGSYATATAELIENRCKRMIVVLSPEFLCSGHCDFQAKFALSLSPGARVKRMVPIMITPCTTPSILRHITMCDYTKEALRAYFWPRLYRALDLN